MARILEFEPDKTLQKAMLLFWRQGISNTSIEDLVQTTKVQRSGLYKVFGGKKKLVQKSLELYVSQIIDSNIGVLKDKNADLKSIRLFFEQFIFLLNHPMAKYGCFMCFTAMEVAKTDRAIFKVIDSSILKIESHFVSALKNSKLSDAPSKSQILEKAHFFVGSIFGINSLLRAGASDKIVTNYIKGVLSVIDIMK